jgi:hypothetical protein
MPERYTPVGRGRHQKYSLGQAAEAGLLIIVKCTVCRRCVHYLAADLLKILPPNVAILEPFCRCKKCGTGEFMRIETRFPHPGDIGQIVVRRPVRKRVVWDWRDVPL